MKTGTKVAVIIGACLIGIGFVFALVAFASGITMRNAMQAVDRQFDAAGNLPEEYGEDIYMEESSLVLRGNTYPAADVRRFEIDIAGAETKIIAGNDFSVLSADIPCTVRFDSGTLSISTKRRYRVWPFGALWKSPKVVITVPEHARPEFLSVKVGAGSLVCTDTALACGSGRVDVGMGECLLYNLDSAGDFDVKCGMGSVDLQGRITGSADINCGMGDIKMTLTGVPQDYSYTASVGMGRARINNTELNGMGGRTQSPYSGKYHLNIDCGMGSVEVQIAE